MYIMCNSLLILIVIIVMCNGRQRFKPGSSVTGSAGAQMAFSIFTMRMKPVMMTLVIVTPIMTDSVNSDGNDVSKKANGEGGGGTLFQ